MLRYTHPGDMKPYSLELTHDGGNTYLRAQFDSDEQMRMFVPAMHRRAEELYQDARQEELIDKITARVMQRLIDEGVLEALMNESVAS